MLSVKAGLMVALLLSSVLNGAASCDTQKSGNVKSANQEVKSGANGNNQQEPVDAKADLKTLAEGQYSSVSNAFIMVARDADTYNELRKLVSSLPEQGRDFFKSNLVVAAFLGERRTGGYGVRFLRGVNTQLVIQERVPPKGAITTQAITYPFSVVAVPVNDQQAISINASNPWRAAMRTYGVKGGEFTVSGGIAGRSNRYSLTGTIAVMREGDLATFFLDLVGNGGKMPQAWKEVASGLVQASGSITISYLRPGYFVEQPADALRATGLFTTNETGLTLTFESLPGNIRDGFSGRGTLKAVATGPAPRKTRRAAAVDVPQ